MIRLLLVMLLVGCTTTEQGKSIDRSNVADLGSTAIALSQGGVEANPLGLALVPIKLGMGKMIEDTTEDCYKLVFWASVANPMYYGFAANNLGWAIGTTAAPVVGLTFGGLYYLFKEEVEPDAYSCVPDVPAVQAFAESYKTGEVELLERAFAENAIEGENVGLEVIQARYAELYSRTKDRTLWFRTPEYMSAQIGELFWHYRYSMEFDSDGKISVFTYEPVTVEVMESL